MTSRIPETLPLGWSTGAPSPSCSKGTPQSGVMCASNGLSNRNLRRLRHVGIVVTDFAIEPELRVRLPGKRDTLSLRSIDAAADFVRERIGRNPNRMWVGVLYRLEAARTKEDAVEATNALRALLEAEGSLLTERH